MVQGQLVSLKRGEAYSCEEEFIDVTVTITPLQKQTNKQKLAVITQVCTSE